MAEPDVWVTRARPGAEATAARLRQLGRVPLVAPLLEVRSIEVEVDLAGVGALAFTSANAVPAAPRAAVGLPVFAVGDATADAARTAGFAAVESASGDVAALAALIARRRGAFAGDLLHLCASEPAGDLRSPLEAAGVRLRQTPVYETVSLPITADVEAAWPHLSAVLLHSPKAARAFDTTTASWSAGHLDVLCLSEAVAAPLGRRAARILVADRPDEAALLNLLDSDRPQRGR